MPRTHRPLAPAPSSLLTAAQVYSALRHIAQVSALVPRLPLDARRRMILSGRLFREAPEVVEAVAAALEDRALFGRLPPCPAALRARQARAQALRGLQHLCLQVAERAADLALADESETIGEAMAVLRAVRAEAAPPTPPAAVDGARRRLRALRGAEALLRRRQARQRARRRGGAGAPGGEAAAPRAAPARAQGEHTLATFLRSDPDTKPPE